MFAATVGVSGTAWKEQGRETAIEAAGFAMPRRRRINGRWAMSAAVLVLPVIWATEALDEIHEVRNGGEVAEAGGRKQRQTERQVAPGLEFYRKYTEGLLRRYVKMAMEVGRAPSLLGRDMFRARVTNYQVHGFDDVVIFVHDVEQCLAKLDREQQLIIERVALQEYTQVEAAGMLGLTARTLVRRYDETLDMLTEILLERKLLQPRIACQEAPVLL
jgi:hypothetical protein